MIGKILTRLFALFGMTLTCVACYGVPEAEYHPEHTTTGRVVDSKGNPIGGIQVKDNLNSTTYSGTDGEFYIAGSHRYVEFKDVDGAANGDYADKLVMVEYHDGALCELGDVVLNEKE